MSRSPSARWFAVGTIPPSRIVGDEWCHAMNSPAAPVTFSVRARIAAPRRSRSARGARVGPGSSSTRPTSSVARRPHGFAPTNVIVASLHRRLRGLRMIRLGAIFDLAVATTIEQRVTTIEARRSWRTLVRRHGEPAPGDRGLVVPPSAPVLAALPDWEWRRIGVEGRRSATMNGSRATRRLSIAGRGRRRGRRAPPAERSWRRAVDGGARDAPRVR